MTAAACHRLLDEAAHDALGPLGLSRLDASTWLDDHGWWVVAADFETLGARGTRLVIYADFLWHLRERPARTVAARVRERGRLLDQDGSELACGYESEAQFAPLAAGLAERAATEIHAWREGSRRCAAGPPTSTATPRTAGCGASTTPPSPPRWRATVPARGTGSAASSTTRSGPSSTPTPTRTTSSRPSASRAASRRRLDDDGAFRAAVAERVVATRARLELPPVTLA